MSKLAAVLSLLLLFFVGQAQEVSLPADLRQHTLNHYNASLFNPAFSLDRNNPQSVAFWTRWQWQSIDADPTTLFLNYSRRLDEKSGAAVGFFQHNTGIYFNTGGTLNYAYQLEFNRLIKLSFGANVFGFVQELADTRFPVNPIPGIPQSTPTNDFILQVAPGFNLQVENFSLSLASENLFDYNFSDKAANTASSDKIFMGMASYDFPVMASDSTAYIRPSIYLRTIPEQENQIGLNALFSTQKYWIQSGYNNFYGISVGAGGTFFNRFSIGALVEFGTGSSVEPDVPSLDSSQPSFEILASYYLGKPEQRRPLVASGIAELEQSVALNEEEPTNEKIQEELEKAEKLANQKEEENEPEPEQVDEEEVQDEEMNAAEEMIDKTKTKAAKKEARRLAAEQKALEKQQRKDSIAEVKREKEALAMLKKQEEEQAKKDAETAKEAQELEAEEAKKAAELAQAEREKEQQRQDELQKKKDKEALAEAQRVEQQRKLDSISHARKAAAVTAEMNLKAQQRQDSISEAKKAEAAAATTRIKEQQRLDSIARVNEAKELADQKAADEAEALVEAEKAEQTEPEVVKPQAGEKYEEVANEGDLESGYYLIANVFGTKKYFDAFMQDLTNKGLQPKSFFRSRNKYNYAYLERYDTISAARQARDSKFDGKYNGKTWIFRVVGK